MNNFSISEFIIDGDIIPLEVADKIIKHHISIAQPIRDALGCAIWPSEHSGYRSVEWELSHNRSGTSQHCFKGFGATDWTSGDRFKVELLWEELKKSSYKRICYYPDNGFIHCDHYGDDKVNFICDSSTNNKWERI